MSKQHLRMLPAMLLVPLVVSLGCSDSTAPPPATPDRLVKVEGDHQATAPGQALPAELVVEVQESDGTPVPDLPVSFTPMDGGSVEPKSGVTDAAGRASAVWTLGTGDGVHRLTVEAGDEDVEFTATACDAEPLNMTAGEVVSRPVTTGEGCIGISLASAASGDRFRIAVVRTVDSAGASDTIPVRLSVSGPAQFAAPDPMEVAAARPATAPPVSIDARALERLMDLRSGTRHVHEELRRNEMRLAERMPSGSVLREVPAALRAPAAAELPETLRIDPTTPSNCSPAGERQTAVKIAEDDRMAIYQDSAQNASSSTRVTQAQANEVLAFYRDHGDVVIDEYFDGVPDTDGNGKVIVFITPAVSGNTAAFVWSGDFYSQDRCPASNEGEYIFFNYSLFQDVDDGDPPYSLAMEVLTHEAKHVSSLYRRVLASDAAAGQNRFHPSWVEEGTAEIAGEVASRHAWQAAGGPAINAELLEDDWRASTGEVNSGNVGVLLLLLRTQGYLASQPNSILVDPSGSSDEHSFYGSSWHFHRFLGDAYGGAGDAPMAEADLFRALNAQGTAPGVAGIEQVTGTSWEDLLEEYAAASMMNGQSVSPPARAFATYDFVSAIELFCFAVDPKDFVGSGCDTGAAQPGPPGAFPWPVTTDSEGNLDSRTFETAIYAGPLGPAGMRVHDFVSGGTGDDVEIRLTADVTADEPARIVVVRLH